MIWSCSWWRTNGQRTLVRTVVDCGETKCLIVKVHALPSPSWHSCPLSSLVTGMHKWDIRFLFYTFIRVPHWARGRGESVVSVVKSDFSIQWSFNWSHWSHNNKIFAIDNGMDEVSSWIQTIAHTRKHSLTHRQSTTNNTSRWCGSCRWQVESPRIKAVRIRTCPPASSASYADSDWVWMVVVVVVMVKVVCDDISGGSQWLWYHNIMKIDPIRMRNAAGYSNYPCTIIHPATSSNGNRDDREPSRRGGRGGWGRGGLSF